MRILHYFLGFHRQGGLNRYAADLAATQARNGDEVFALYPDGSLLPQKHAKLHCKGMRFGVRCFSLTGGRSVPLLEGVRDPQRMLDFPRILPTQKMENFWQVVRPEILHIHTWMGFPEELLPVAKAHDTKIVYTTHDYFGLCPMVNRLKPDGTVCDHACNEECSKCNCNAPGERYLEIRNCEALIRLKSLLLPLKNLLTSRNGNAVAETTQKTGEIKPFEALRAHYLELWRQCGKLHFNSPVTQAIFSKALPDVLGEIVAITHNGIADRRPANAEIHQVLHLAFFGSAKPYKGLPMLLKVLKQLQADGLTQWRLDVYGCDGESAGAVQYHGFFKGREEWQILTDTDLLIVPSVWDETFGFVVEEALCAGVPVLCSDKVGAKMLIDPEWIFCGENGLLQKLRNVLTNPSSLLEEKRKIRKTKQFIAMGEHVEAMNDFYRGWGIEKSSDHRDRRHSGALRRI